MWGATNEISKMGIAIRGEVMKIFYVWEVKTKIYAGSVECKQGMNPSNSTDIKPPKFKAMNEIVWSGEGWEYQPME